MKNSIVLSGSASVLVLWVACSSGDLSPPSAGGSDASAASAADGAVGDGSTGSTGGSGGTNGGGGASGEGGEAGSSEASVPAVLDDLVVTGAEPPLKPAFSSDNWRYSVRAKLTPEPVIVTATARPALDIEIDGIRATSGEPLTLADRAPDSEFSVTVSNADGESTKYTIVYLPADFPDFQVDTNDARASSDPLYLTTRAAGAYFAVKLSNAGVPLFYRRTSVPGFDFKKHATGQMSYAEYDPDTGVAEQVVLDDSFVERDRVTSVDLVDTDPHDFLIEPGGNYIVLAYEPATRDLTAFGRDAASNIVDGVIQKLSPDRDILFQWNTWNHMSFGDSTYLEQNPEDYSHLNSVFVDDDGNYIVSSRGQSQVLKLDHSTGKVIWRLGGATNDFTFVDDPFGGLCGQHTASILDNGHLLLFDNGQHCYPEVPERGELTRIVEYELDDEAMTATLVWSYHREGAYCVSQGSAQRLSNGNTLIGWGVGTGRLATEVTHDGEIVYDLSAKALDRTVSSYRAWRFPD